MVIIYAMSRQIFMRTIITMRYVYILRCADETFYTGMTKDLERRCNEHNGDLKWAKYTKARRPVELLWSSDAMTRNDAAREEMRIKSLSKAKKISFISVKE